ncbi:MAG: hypothetical protein WCL57_07610, partial [Chloroflexota bacterium]|jgi:hypothetical protein|nr:hypothetical protein [Chloroflexota bacterium]
MAIQHPDFEHPLILIMTNVKLTPDETYIVFKSRWGIEQPPLVTKQWSLALARAQKAVFSEN